MKTKELIRRADKLAKPFRVVDAEKFHLKDIDPADTLGFDSVGETSRLRWFVRRDAPVALSARIRSAVNARHAPS